MEDYLVEKQSGSSAEVKCEENSTSVHLLSMVLSSLVGQCSKEHQISIIGNDAVPEDLLSNLYKVIQKSDCSAYDIELFSVTLNYLINTCGYTLKSIKPSLLHSAAEANNMAVVLKLLLSHKARFNEVNPTNWETILHTACRLKSALRYVYVLAFPDLLIVPDNNGNRPIHIACQKNDILFISWLFKSILGNEMDSCAAVIKIDRAFISGEAAPDLAPPLLSTKCSKVSATNLVGHSVYHIAASNNYCQLLRVLLDVLESLHDELELDAVVMSGSESTTPLGMAIAHQHPESLRLLLEFLNKHGLIQKALEERQYMQRAADDEDVNVIKLLVEYGFSHGLEYAIGKVKDQQLQRLLLYYYTQLTSLRAILETQPDYKKGSMITGKIKWNEVSIETINVAWINDFVGAMESISRAIQKAELSPQSLHDLCTVQYLASECLNNFKPCTLQLNSKPFIPITFVSITCCSLKSVPPELFQLPNIEFLNLSNNCIQELPSSLQSIYSSQTLKKLVLDGNQLKTLPEDLFLGLVNSLEQLSVQKNELSELPPGLWVMPHLKELNLSENKLSQLHYWSDITFFMNPDFSKHVLTTLGHDHDFYGCESFIFKDNISQGSNEHHEVLKYLQMLQLFYQTLKAATYGKFQVENLEEWVSFLHAQRCHQQVEKHASEFQCRLPEAFINKEIETSALMYLNVSRNLFTEIPQELPCLAPNLHHLNMSHNHIKYLDLIHDMPSKIGTVHLDHNCIENMEANCPPRSFCLTPCMLLQLQTPYMGSCSHSTHTTLKSLLNLQLGHNKLEDFCSANFNAQFSFEETVVCSLVVQFPQLSILSLENNELTYFPSSILNMTSLNSLNLAHNKGIRSLPSKLGLLSLSTLNLEGLSLPEIPINLMKHFSPMYLLGYLKGIYHGKESYRHMKLMLVGSANAGKTTLLQQLTRKGKMALRRAVQIGINGRPLSTVGVDLGEWEFSPDMSSPKVTFMTWDFGGQEQYYATHQCFISHRSLYLVIWDAREGERGLKNISVWLENIEAQAPNAPVIVIGTHADHIKNAATLGEIFRRLYIQYNPNSFAYPKIQTKCFFVNNYSSSDMKELRKYIYQFATIYRNPDAKKDAPPILDEPIPSYYMALLKIIKTWAVRCNVQNRNPIFTKKEYLSEIQQHFPGSVKDIVEASSFWHDNGIIFHHKSVTMDELYCIDPQWLCAVLAKVVTVQETNPFQKNGFMRQEDFVNLYTYSKHRMGSMESFITAIINIMQSFEIILLLDQQSILIPSLLSQQREEARVITQDSSNRFSVQDSVGHDVVPITDHPNVLLRHYILPFVPSGFFGRLISRICASRIVFKCKTIFEASKPLWSCWRDGICLICNGTELLRIVPVTYPLPGTGSTCIVTSSGHETVAKLNGIEVRVAILKKVHSYPVSLRGKMVRQISKPVDPMHAATWLLQQAIEHIDSIFNDWYEAFGRKRGFELSTIDQGTPCTSCEKQRIECISMSPSNERVCAPDSSEHAEGLKYYLFSSRCCTHNVLLKQNLQCPLHGSVSVSQIAPDLVFGDFPHSMIYEADAITTEHMLGRGGYGSVYSGTMGKNVNASQTIAIKIFEGSHDFESSSESMAWEKYQQISREARVVCRLIHDNILQLMGIVIAPFMLLLELAPLGDLTSCVEKFKQVNEKLNLGVLSSTLIQVAQALDYIHSKRFVFRDLKPGNVLAWKFPLPNNQWNSDSAVHVKLADYGICQQYTLQGVRGAEGTPPYLPPEVLIHCGQQSHSTKLDVYSFGMLMYYLISFEPPFHGQSRPVSALLQEGKRPSLSLKQCPPTLGLLELMCWCWSEHPYHRPEFKEVLAALKNGCTSRLASAFPIASYNPIVVAACTKCILSSSLLSQHSTGTPGYLNPFGCSKLAKQAVSLDVWCACKDGLKCISCQPYNCTTKDIEPGECITLVATSHDQIWVSKIVSTGGRLNIYNAKKYSLLKTWHTEDHIRKLIYNSTKEVVVAVAGNKIHIFPLLGMAENFKPILSHTLIENVTEVVLVKVAEEGEGCELHIWYSVESKLKDLKLSPLRTTCETFRQDSHAIRHMEALWDADCTELNHIVLSHGSCIEKWKVQNKELLETYECYNFCAHLYNKYRDKSKVRSLLYWKGVLYVGTVGGVMVVLNAADMTVLWTIQASETPISLLLGATLDLQEELGSQYLAVLRASSSGSNKPCDSPIIDTLQPNAKSANMVISFSEKYTGVFKGSTNVPPSLNPPGEPHAGNEAPPHLKLLTTTSCATHIFMWSPAHTN